MPATPNQQLHIAICDDESIDRQQAADLTRAIMTAEGLGPILHGPHTRQQQSAERNTPRHGEERRRPKAHPFFHRPVLPARF